MIKACKPNTCGLFDFKIGNILETTGWYECL
jgi:hypothetical protein